VAASPNCCILVVSNPVDVCTWIVNKLAGLPPGRVFGSGTALDSSRFRTLLAERFGVDTRSVHAVVLGEHGDSSVAAWSAVILGNQLLRHVKPHAGLPGDPDNFAAIHTDVIQSAYRVIEAKGHTNWAIGLTVASLTEALLRNDHRILPLSVPVRGLYGIEEDVYLSLPAVLGRSGVRDIVPVTLDEHEQAKLRASAAAIYAVQANLKF
jgi:L-lactate dehydrogenase